MVDQEVDDDAGDADVEPERESPSSDEAMLIETPEPSAAKGDEDQRDDDDSEDRVRGEKGEVDGADPALALEVDNLVNADVVDHIGDEEDAGDDEGGDHEDFVDFALAAADGGVAGGEENGAGTVESGVESGVGEHG